MSQSRSGITIDCHICVDLHCKYPFFHYGFEDFPVSPFVNYLIRYINYQSSTYLCQNQTLWKWREWEWSSLPLSTCFHLSPFLKANTVTGLLGSFLEFSSWIYKQTSIYKYKEDKFILQVLNKLFISFSCVSQTFSTCRSKNLFHTSDSFPPF